MASGAPSISTWPGCSFYIPYPGLYPRLSWAGGGEIKAEQYNSAVQHMVLFYVKQVRGSFWPCNCRVLDRKLIVSKTHIHTHTHTPTYIYLYIYIHIPWPPLSPRDDVTLLSRVWRKSFSATTLDVGKNTNMLILKYKLSIIFSIRKG